ncbi:MAG TPA: TetR/AcrR family transcriptional regulator [Cyclobacteriaceae bacterium]
MASLAFKLNDHLFLKDPQHTLLGQNIISKSVELIDKLGFELFTFKKLAFEITSTEASIYRYFENKHRLLLYLVSWYWNWIEYRIEISTSNIHLPEDKLKAGLRVITDKKSFDSSFAFVDEEALHRIVIAELDKTYLTKDVDRDNQEGLFGGFKSLCNKIANLISDVGPEYPFPNSLASTIVLAAKQQLFFSSHLPSLSSLRANSKIHDEIYKFIESLIFNTIKPKSTHA